MKISCELGDLPAVELPFARQYFGNGRFGDAGAFGRGSLPDAFLLQQEAKQLSDWHRLDRHRFSFESFDQAAQHVKVIPFRRRKFWPVDERVNDDDGGIQVGVAAQWP